MVGNSASALGTQPNAYSPAETDITTQAGSSTQIITSTLTGGQLGGLLLVLFTRYRRQGLIGEYKDVLK